MTNFYNYKVFSELYENNVSSIGFSLKAANSITGDDIKLSERLYIPQKKLRGFVNGSVGPKDGDDFIGGNYYAIVNFNSTLPQILPNSQNIDISTFIDVANLWGVDDKSLDESSEIRSSIGLGIDWFTPVGPLNFSLLNQYPRALQIKQKLLDLILEHHFNVFFKKIYFSFILTILNFSSSIAAENIVFIDIDYVLNNSSLGKSIYNDLEKINKNNIDLLSKKEKLLKKKEEINKTKNIVSKDQLEKILIYLIKKWQNLKKKKII